jgi:hypothetical protein
MAPKPGNKKAYGVQYAAKYTNKIKAGFDGCAARVAATAIDRP